VCEASWNAVAERERRGAALAAAGQDALARNSVIARIIQQCDVAEELLTLA